MANSDSVFSDLELYGGDGYVPYESKDPLNDPKSFTFRYKVIKLLCAYIKFCLKTLKEGANFKTQKTLKGHVMMLLSNCSSLLNHTLITINLDL